VEVVMVGAIAAPLLNLGVWEIVFRLWPSPCRAPDGSELLCIVTAQYTEPRDLTAAALSIGFGLLLAAGVYLRVARSNHKKRGLTRSSSPG
jgi:hypothetical protein